VTVDLFIAGYLIRLHSDDSVNLNLDDRFRTFLSSRGGVPDLSIKVSDVPGVLPAGATRVFSATLLEESTEGPKSSGEPFWEIATDNDATYVVVTLSNPSRNLMLLIPKNSMSWQIFTESDGPDTDPLPYPLDGLILYYLVSLRGGIILHGSGVICENRGWIFTGRSGSGKTTMAMIFDRGGDRVVHDDRLILKREGEKWMMHSTPVYRNDEPRSAEAHHIWIISHGRSNISSPLSGAEAAGMIIANCIQQNWDREATSRLTEAVNDLISSVKVSRLDFIPDDSIRDYLSVRENRSFVTTSQVASSILAEGKGLIITAGGYSMWPALRPGDRIAITPFSSDDLSDGDVVALRRDGGFVVHRITELKRDTALLLLRTRGDTNMAADPWVTERDVVGIAVNVTRKGKTLAIGSRCMPYLFGWFLSSSVSVWKRVLHRGASDTANKRKF
jgi:signal peptidase I